MSFRNWAPIRVYEQNGELWVDWCWLGTKRFSDPFFEMTIARCMQDSFAVLFRRQTPLSELQEWIEQTPGLAPSGFIFHFSRCGSTLVSQMLAALPQNVVISEAGPIDAILRPRVDPADQEEKIARLRAIVGSLGQSRAGGESQYFIKFDAWHMCEWPLIRRAFPDVPWIFVYRDPVEVLVSQLRNPGGWTIPGVLNPGPTVGLPMAEVVSMPRDQYCARVLASIARAALDAVNDPDGGGLLVDYRDLPEGGWTSVAQHFGMKPSQADIETMREASGYDAKVPGLSFTPDSESKRRSASPRLAQMADEWLMPLYQELERKRLKIGAETT